MKRIFEPVIAEMKRIEMLEDENEKKIRYDLLDHIIDSINEYEGHLADYEYQQKRRKMKERGIEFVPLSKKDSLIRKWGRLFASGIEPGKKQQIFYNQFRWHLFSYKVLPALEPGKARQAFNRCKKSEVYVFYQWKDEAYEIRNSSKLKSSNFDRDDDVYLFDPIEKWTYVHTHEVDCGPYFYKIK